MAEEHKQIDPITGTATTGHEWDGIKELDTPLPRWWLWVFYGCIAWAVAYWILMPAWPGLHDYTQQPQQIIDRYGTGDAIEKTLTEMRPTRKRLLLEPGDRRGQPVMLTEFGGLSYFPRQGEAWFGYATAQSEEQYLSMMKGLFDAIYASSDLAGFCYTQFTDTMQETNGLLDENRQPKLPVDKLRDIIWQPSRAVQNEYLDIERQKALRTSSGQVV